MLYTSAKINISYSILFNLTTSYSSYFGGKKGISRNKTSFFLLMQELEDKVTHHQRQAREKEECELKGLVHVLYTLSHYEQQYAVLYTRCTHCFPDIAKILLNWRKHRTHWHSSPTRISCHCHCLPNSLVWSQRKLLCRHCIAIHISKNQLFLFHLIPSYYILFLLF